MLRRYPSRINVRRHSESVVGGALVAMCDGDAGHCIVKTTFIQGRVVVTTIAACSVKHVAKIGGGKPGAEENVVQNQGGDVTYAVSCPKKGRQTEW